MKKTITLMQAPAQMSPGNYIKKAYTDQNIPVVKTLDIITNNNGNGWEIQMLWQCPNTVNTTENNTDSFVDAAALLVPIHENANWLTMGSQQAPVEGALWRADKRNPMHIKAQGLGSVERNPAPNQWRIKASHKNGIYHLQWLFPKWKSLQQFNKCGFAIWSGANNQRAGLKSVTSDWIHLL